MKAHGFERLASLVKFEIEDPDLLFELDYLFDPTSLAFEPAKLLPCLARLLLRSLRLLVPVLRLRQRLCANGAVGESQVRAARGDYGGDIGARSHP